MKIKRTVAPDMRQAIRRVREEQGPDAVILANRRVPEGVEIISAIDLDAEALSQAADILPSAASAASAPKPVTAAPSGQVSGYASQAASAYKASAAEPEEQNDEFASRLAEMKANAKSLEFDPDAPTDEHVVTPQAAPQHRNYAESAASEPPIIQPIAPGPAASSIAPQGPSFETHRPMAGGQDHMLQDMQRELQSLRGLLQNQMSVMEWNRVSSKHPLRVILLSRLNSFGISMSLGKEIVEKVTETKNIERAWRQALGVLASRIPVANDDFMDYGGVVAIVGPTGVGKTTTIAKLAARFAMRHGSRNVALVSTDNYRVGAHEQLLNYARLLNVPMKTAGTADELSRVLNSLYDKKLVLVDTAGMSQRDMRLSEHMATLREGSPLIRPYLTISATSQLKALDETIAAFSRVDLAGCILTKLDEAVGFGAALSSVISHQLPINYLGVGQRVPEDLQLARAHRLVTRAVSGVKPEDQTADPEEMAAKFAEVPADAT